MQDLTPDMEELLRRAAASYPLTSGEDRWGEIEQQLADSTSTEDRTQLPTHNRWHSPVLLFLMLLPWLFLNEYKQPGISHILINKAAIQPGISHHNTDQEPGNIENSTGSNAIRMDGIKYKTNRSIGTHAGEQFFNKKETNVEIATRKNQRETVSSHYVTLQQPVRTYMAPSPGSRPTMFNNDQMADKTPVSKKRVRIYAGITTAIHLSAIKELKYDRTGFSTGFVVGFKFRSPLSIETGLLYSRKYYWTPGKDFSMDEMGAMPPGMEIMDVHGSNTIIEWPVHIRYDLLHNYQHSFYVSSGCTSYFMTAENNQYNTMYNGTASEMTGDYHDNRNYLIGSLDMALGYERRIGSRYHLRFEPFLQLPLRDMGVGQLPVKTAGLRLGITRSSW